MVEPLVSVIIPVYNMESHVVAAIESMLDQSYSNIEVIIVNDGSTDRSAINILQSISDDRVYITTHPSNKGAAEARNTGIRAAKGGLIAFLDADDFSEQNRVASQVEFLDRHPEIGGLGSAVSLFDGDIGEIAPMCNPDDVAASTMFSCEFLMPSLMVRRSAIEKGHILFNQEYGANCDWEFVANLVRHTKVCNLREPLVKYRRWSGQMTTKIVDTLDCPATKLRSEMLEWFGLPVAKQDLAAHIMLAPCYWPLQREPGEPVDGERAERWLQTIWSVNERTRRFKSDSLAKVLANCRAGMLAK